ncbi:hypothetical protein QQX98_006795 [Neonectria punicea]|uniref:Uncharacterized protein n=1 Tax=Neonectria punicea TaxID=979145 RepID=A0ABR1GZU8_9HYPO
MAPTNKNRPGIRDRPTPRSTADVPLGPPRSERRRANQRTATNTALVGGEGGGPDFRCQAEDSVSEDPQPPTKRRAQGRDTGAQDAKEDAERHAGAAPAQTLAPDPGPVSSSSSSPNSSASPLSITSSNSSSNSNPSCHCNHGCNCESKCSSHSNLDATIEAIVSVPVHHQVDPVPGVNLASPARDALPHGSYHQIVVVEAPCSVPQPHPHRGARSHGDNDHAYAHWIDNDTPATRSPSPTSRNLGSCDSPHWNAAAASLPSNAGSPCPHTEANGHSKPVPVTSTCENAATSYNPRLASDHLVQYQAFRRAQKLERAQELKESWEVKQAYGWLPDAAPRPGLGPTPQFSNVPSFSSSSSSSSSSPSSSPSSSFAVLPSTSVSHSTSTPNPYQATSSNSNEPSSSSSTRNPQQGEHPQARRFHTSRKGKGRATRSRTPPFLAAGPQAGSDDLGFPSSEFVGLNLASNDSTAPEDQQQLYEDSVIDPDSERDDDSEEESDGEPEDWIEDDDLYEGLGPDAHKYFVDSDGPGAFGLSSGDGPREGTSRAHAEEHAREGRIKRRAEILVVRHAEIEIDDSWVSDEDTKVPDEDIKVSEETLAALVRSLSPESTKFTPHETSITNKRKLLSMCKWDKNDPMGECITCQKVSMNSMKTIHRNPCVRFKISEVVLYRRGGLNLTRRWDGISMKDVGDRICPNDVRVVYVASDTYHVPLALRVVKFEPKEGDVTARFWNDYSVDGEVQRKKKELACYCLHDIYNTADVFEEFVIENAVPAMIAHVTRFTKNKPGVKLDVIEKTYKLAIRHFCEIAIKPPGVKHTLDDKIQMRMLGNLFILWFAIQNTTGSSWLVGDETLGMEPVTEDPSYPLLGKISIPRMIIAQFDNLNYTRVLEKYRNRVMHELEWLMTQGNPDWWLTIYLVIFILLREASGTSSDRYRHARQNYGTKAFSPKPRFCFPRYSIPEFVEALQKGCNNVLFHWHYYNWEKWPDPANGLPRENTHLAYLTPYQWSIVKGAKDHLEVKKQLSFWTRYKQGNSLASCRDGHVPVVGEYEGPQTKFDWDNPFYWIAQLYDKGWYPQPTYQREPIPVSPK